MSGQERGETERLREENTLLLDELESAYRVLEQSLGKAKYETQVAYQELRKRNDKLRQANQQVRDSLSEKEVLIREIHHRVKNNLQIISSLLALQARRIQDEQTRAIFDESRSRIKTMALIHEKLYQSHELASIDFAGYARDLATSLLQAYMANSSAVRLQTNIGHFPLSVDTAVHCGLIINELVLNAIKYAFPSGREGKISIQAYQDQGSECTLIIRDNGIGFPEDIDFHHPETLGLQLVHTMVQQLKGRIELDRSDGTRIKMVFPASGQTSTVLA